MPLLLSLLLVLLLVAPANASPLTASLIGENPHAGGVFRFPQGIAVAGDRVFVGDQYSGVIQVFDRGGNFLFHFGSRASRRERGRLGIVGGVAADRSGHVYVLDAEFDRVQVFSAANGRYLTSFGDASWLDLGAGISNDGGISSSGVSVWQRTPGSDPVLFVADQGFNRVVRLDLDRRTLRPKRKPRWSSPQAELNNPQGLGVDPQGRKLYVADDKNHRVAVLDARSLRLIGQFGSFGTGAGQFRDPFDVSVDAAGRIYVADNLNNRVDVFDQRSWNSLGTWGVFGRRIGTFSIVRAVSSLVDDPAGGVWVTDTANNRIQALNAAGQVQATWGIAGRGQGYFSRPRSVAVDSRGGLAVADSFAHRVARFDPDGTYVGDFGRITDYHGYAYSGPGRGQLRLPTGIAFDQAGVAWVADWGNRRLQGFGPDGKVVYQSARGDFRSPQAVSPGPDGSVLVADTARGAIEQLMPDRTIRRLQTGLHYPGAVAWGGGRIYAADHRRVLEVGSGRTLPAPDGQAWDQPAGLAVDPRDGSLYVSERRPRTPNGARVLHGIPEGGGWRWETLAREGAGWGKVIDPAGLAAAADGSVYVADWGNSRVWRLHPADAPDPVRHQLQVTVTPQAGGRVLSQPGGIGCPGDCTQLLGDGREITLRAEAWPGYMLQEWTGACSGSASTCTVRMDGAEAVGAVFVEGGPMLPPQPPPPPRPPVRLSGVALASPYLRHALPPRARRPGQPARTTNLSLRLSRPVTLTLTLQQGRPGRKAGGRCTPSRRRRSNCVRWVDLPLWYNRRLLTGTHRLPLGPVFQGRRLDPGLYRLQLVVTDWNGNRVQAPPMAVRVLPAPRRNAGRPSR